MLIGRRVNDIRSVLQRAAEGFNIKYKPEKGSRHFIYLPYGEMEVATEKGVEKVKALYIMELDVHEWVTIDGKYRTAPCLKDVVREENGVILNDGTCPFCDRIPDAWQIYKYRYENEEKNCGKTGQELKNHLENVRRILVFERKIKEPKTYIYMLVAQFKTSHDGKPVLSEGFPEYDFKVMKLSTARLQKIKEIIENAGASELGCELVISYPNEEDPRVVVSQSTISAIFPSNKFTVKYPGLEEKINKEAEKFNFDVLNRVFPEWNLVTVGEAKAEMDNQFRMWDQYKLEKATDPSVKYIEYKTSKVSHPAIEEPSLDDIFNGDLEL